MSATLFYKQAVPINRDAHRHTKIQIQPGHFSFAQQTNALPVSASEFVEAARHYPIVFVADEAGGFSAAAVLGLQNGRNLFVTPEGEWRADTYIPAFARRYPFVLGATDDAGRLAVCLDASYPGVNEADGIALFEQGKETAYLSQMMEFLGNYQDDIAATGRMVQRLNDLGLLATKTLTLSRPEGDIQLGGFWTVDDDKFAKLDDATIVELHRSGILRLLEWHRASLRNLAQLAALFEAGQKRSA
ncbi:SapC family protein [Bordetella avium]|uniref:SapC-related protein n=1 Tax=Bordetella avium (strain 197N) TaxID=360910 RepID=Q2L1N1_BORA1|nr:SapC family protein [Bordetella avium]AZY48994.1 SapC family protein [Bordetella avium]AZY52355.1 SapC family protein [Bordetella avium]RIQ50077.1 SapC family protein [Bordetella avium]RIQ68072.1 SapC family protein [Bordetella avium]RIQ71164.1 SapC family protein [Bordetella avium]